MAFTYCLANNVIILKWLNLVKPDILQHHYVGGAMAVQLFQMASTVKEDKKSTIGHQHEISKLGINDQIAMLHL